MGIRTRNGGAGGIWTARAVRRQEGGVPSVEGRRVVAPGVGLEAEQSEGQADLTRAGAECCSNVAGPRQAQEADREIAYARHDLRGAVLAHLGAVFVIGAVADVVELVLDRPVTAVQFE